jgi:hypothetical protein
VITGVPPAAEIVRVTVMAALVPPAEVALTVKVLVPAVVGVPDTTPVEVFAVRPAGSAPKVKLVAAGVEVAV